MTDGVPRFDALYAVSDLHIGGRPGAQIFNKGNRLAAFIEHVAKDRPRDEVALVLNGDVIDPLIDAAPGNYMSLDAGTALRMMGQLYEEPAFKPVWSALAALLATPRRRLVIVLGNHDLELALPPVQHWLRQRLAGDAAAARERILFSTQGAGYACLVGDASVFCTHGNEIDPWNWVDYNALGQLANLVGAGRRVEAERWPANAGTRLVIDAINRVKRAYSFVDLLKPEAAAVLGVLIGLRHEALRHVDWNTIVDVVRGRLHGRRVVGGVLGEADDHPAEDGPSDLVSLLGPRLRKELATPILGDALMLAALQDVESGRVPGGHDDDGPETLGRGTRAYAVVSAMLGWVEPAEALRRALCDLLRDNDDAHTVTTLDNEDRKLCEHAAADLDFLVAGHSHLARAAARPDRGWYYNCGTWARLMRLERAHLADPRVFADHVWPKLTARVADGEDAFKALDEGASTPPDTGIPALLLDRTMAVRIAASDGVTIGSLLRVSDAAHGAVHCEPEPNTTFRRS